MKPNEDEIRGKIDKTAGAAKEKIGQLRGDVKLQEEGANQRDAGKVEEGFGKARRKVGEALRDLGKKINR